MALLANTIATGAALVALILTFGPISGAHFNPVVTLADALGMASPGDRRLYMFGPVSREELPASGLPHLMFGLRWYSISLHARNGWALALSEFVASLGLVTMILCCSRLSSSVTPFAVASYITAAYWFTASTSFANPAVTIARAISNTFAGIRPADVPLFIGAQCAGALVAVLLFHWFLRQSQEGQRSRAS